MHDAYHPALLLAPPKKKHSAPPILLWAGMRRLTWWLDDLPVLKLTAKATENGWLEYDCFLLGQKTHFQGRTVITSSSSRLYIRKDTVHIFGVTWLNLKVYTFVTAAHSIHSQFYSAYVTVGTYLQLDAIGLLQCMEVTHCIPCLVCITRFKR